MCFYLTFIALTLTALFYSHLVHYLLVLIDALNLINQQVCWNEDVVRPLRGAVGIKLSVVVFKLVLVVMAGP